MFKGLSMQIAILIIVNIVLASIFYLVISLKLERSASEFREKKLRKEMDEIIREFNATAERNISILENRITVLKRLMEQAGDLRSVDIVLEDRDTAEDAMESNPGKDQLEIDVNVSGAKGPLKDEDSDAGSIKYRAPGTRLITGREAVRAEWGPLRKIREWVISIFNTGHSRPAEYHEPWQPESTVPDENFRTGIDLYDSAELITRDLVKPGRAEDEDVEDNTAGYGPGEEEINQLVSSSEDKYSLIVELSSRGLTAEAIADSSGIPLSEVRLVMNLNNSE